MHYSTIIWLWINQQKCYSTKLTSTPLRVPNEKYPHHAVFNYVTMEKKKIEMHRYQIINLFFFIDYQKQNKKTEWSTKIKKKKKKIKK